MDWALVAKLVVALSPVVVLLVVFERLDVFRLVSGGSVAAYAAAGAALAALSYVSNAHVMDGLPIGFTDYSRYVAPVIEETLKGLIIVGLFAADRVGFKLDAAIAGFAVGAGFSVFENAYLLRIFPEANLGVWLVRGFGTAVMHGGATALFAVLTHEFSEHQAHREGRHARLYPWVFAPGLLVAIAIHSAFNHLPGEPMLAMLAAMVLIPLTLLAVFSKGGATAHEWLEHDHEGHARLLAELREGRFAQTDEGRALDAIAQRFPPRIAGEARAWIELQLTLVLRAEEVLLAHERGEHAQVGEAERAQFHQLDRLGREIGRAGRHAIQPHLRFSRSDLYELHMLRHRVGSGGRAGSPAKPQGAVEARLHPDAGP
jgi:RsiW-degrading membrane proteinase PrsW (M82 family)